MSSLANILALKDLSPLAYQPFLLVSFQFVGGGVLYCCSEQDDGLGDPSAVTYNGIRYQTRVNSIKFQSAASMSSLGIDNYPDVTIELADSDGQIFISYEAAYGFKGATVSIDFVFRDPVRGIYSSDSFNLFTGICDPSNGSESVTARDPETGWPLEAETTRSIRATAGYSIIRKLIPAVPDETRCPRRFPISAGERLYAIGTPYPLTDLWCQYSPDQPNGLGNLVNGVAATRCDKSKATCKTYGMYDQDNGGHFTRQFLGNTYNTPAEFRSKSFTESKTITGVNNANLSQYEQHYPEVYGASWVDALVLNLNGDGNATRFEVIPCVGWTGSNDAADGTTVGIARVEVNGIEVPLVNTSGADILFNWSVLSYGTNQGAFNAMPGYTDSNHKPLGDPHGSLCKLSVIVWNELAASNSVPQVRVLVGDNHSLAGVNGRPLPVYSGPGSFALHRTDNPAWVLLELFRKADVPSSRFNMASVIHTAQVASTMISYTKISGGTGTHRAYGVSLALAATGQRDIASVIQEVRIANNIILRPGDNGLIDFLPKQGLADQQPGPVPGSNSNRAISSFLATDDPAQWSGTGVGYAAYEFTEDDFIPGSLRITQNPIAESPNLIKAKINDEDYDLILDSVEIGDDIDAARSQQTVNGVLNFTTMPNADQALRVGSAYQAELLRGNLRGDSGGTICIEGMSSFKILHLRMGMLVTVTNFQHQLDHQLFRVVGITPGPYAATISVRLQWHEDFWYCWRYGQGNVYARNSLGDASGRLNPYGWQPDYVGNLPYDPLYSTLAHRADTYLTFGLLRGVEVGPDNVLIPAMQLVGNSPVNIAGSVPAPILERLAVVESNLDGEIPGSTNIYVYAASLDATGVEGPLCRTGAMAYIPDGTSTNSITVNVAYYPPQAVGVRFYAGVKSHLLTLAAEYRASLPYSATIHHFMDSGTPPVDVQAAKMVARIKKLVVPGRAVFGVEIDTRSGEIQSNTVTANSITFTWWWQVYENLWGAPLVDHQYDGALLMCFGTADDSEIPFATFRIVTQVGPTLTLDTTAGVDLTTLGVDNAYFVVLNQVVSAIGNTVLLNGMTAGAAQNAVGNLVRVLEGAGATNATRTVSGTDSNHTLILDKPWDDPLDPTSIVVVEEGSWRWSSTTPISCATPNTEAYYTVALQNIQFGPYYVEGVVQNSSGVGPASPHDNPYRLLWWAGEVDPSALINSGLNLITNPDFEVLPKNPFETAAAGWQSYAQTVNNGWTPTRYTGDSVYSAKTSLKVHLGAGITVPPTTPTSNNPLDFKFTTTKKYVVKPGEQYYMSVYTRKDFRPNQPATIQCFQYIFLYVVYSDGTTDQLFGSATTPAAQGWQKVWGRVTVDATKVPLYMQAMLFMTVTNTGKTNYVTQGPLEFDAFFDGAQLTHVFDANTGVNGSLLVTQALPMTITQNSNSGGNCTIWLSWNGSNVPASNGGKFAAIAGSRIWTNLAAGTTYYFYYYGEQMDGTVHFGSGDPPAVPPIGPSADASLACYKDGQIYLGMISVTTPSVSGGAGSGNGGGGSVCPEGDELVFIDGKGVVAAKTVRAGDWIRSRDIHTGETVYRPVANVEVVPSSTWRMVQGHRVSPCDQVWIDGAWQYPYKVGTLDTQPGVRVKISVEGRNHDDQTFTLVDVNGNDSLEVHNLLVGC